MEFTQNLGRTLGKQEQCLYKMYRFVDGILEIGYDRISHILDMVESINFWSDSFRRSFKRKDAILKKIGMHLYEVSISAPAMKDGYLFRYSKDFKFNFDYSAEQMSIC